MKKKLQMLYFRLQDLANRKDGQDLIEYVLIVAMVAFGATISMYFFVTAIITAFGGFGARLASHIG